MEKTSEWLQSFTSEPLKAPLIELENKQKIKSAITLSITGGKGGVGKTSFSLKAALELSKQGFKTLLIDCDYNLSNTAIKLGIPLNNTFHSLLTSRKTFKECLYQNGNFHLLSASNGCLDLFDTHVKLEEIIIDILQEHKSEYDYVILDCPAGLQRETLTLNAYCDHRIFVVTPDKSSVTDSYSLMKVLSHKFGIKRNHVVVNRYKNKKQFLRVVKTLSETVENFLNGRTFILGGLPNANVEDSSFDTFFLENTENELHKKFLKVIGRYTDYVSNQMVTSSNYGDLNQSTEQEVH